MPPTKNQMAETMTQPEAARHGVLTFNDSREVGAVLKANSRKLFGFSIKELPPGFPTEPKTYIFSISEYGEKVDLGRPFPIFEIHPCPEDGEYGEPTVIDPVYMPLEAKVDTTEFVPTTAQQIVDSILKIGPGMNASWDRRKLGWFVSMTNPPSAGEVAQAKAIYTQECQRLLNEGNRYAAANELKEINETHRRAAKFLRQKVDWNKPVTKSVDCPGCGEAVRAGVIWHATPHGCGYVFDVKAYNERFPGNKVAAHTARSSDSKEK